MKAFLDNIYHIIMSVFVNHPKKTAIVFFAAGVVVGHLV